MQLLNPSHALKKKRLPSLPGDVWTIIVRYYLRGFECLSARELRYFPHVWRIEALRKTSWVLFETTTRALLQRTQIVTRVVDEMHELARNVYFVGDELQSVISGHVKYRHWIMQDFKYLQISGNRWSGISIRAEKLHIRIRVQAWYLIHDDDTMRFVTQEFTFMPYTLSTGSAHIPTMGQVSYRGNPLDIVCSLMALPWDHDAEVLMPLANAGLYENSS